MSTNSSTALGIRQMMASLQRGILKMLFEHYVVNVKDIDWERKSQNEIVDQIYGLYLNNARRDDWYKFCSTLYDLSLVAAAQTKNTTTLMQEIKDSGKMAEYLEAVDRPSSVPLQTTLAWIHLNLSETWTKLVQEAYNDQIKSGGRKFYFTPHASSRDIKTRLDDFEYAFADYMTENRSLVKNVHSEHEPVGEFERYIIYHDPAPKNQNEFSSDGEFGTALDKKVEYFCILHKPHAEQPYISIKGEWLTRSQIEKIAEIFISTVLNSQIDSKKREHYDMTRFNVSTLTLKQHPDVKNWRPKSVRIITKYPDAQTEENLFTVSDGDVYEKSCSPYCECKRIPNEWRSFKEIHLEVTMYLGSPPIMQKSIFGADIPSTERKSATYEVKITPSIRQVLRCQDDAIRKKIESILDFWGIVNLNDTVGRLTSMDKNS